ncbi:MAG TPA: hypothetical protein VGI60_05225 [Chthoniobacterales bacterium]|jgi:hypothetical protein
MKQSLQRVAAIVRVDFLVRFRRLSTVVVFLLLSAFAYVWIPAPATGRALIQINDHRAIYNSGAIGLGTASLGLLFVGLFGFYVISNAVRKDIVTRCGLVAASTPMRSGEYLLGKFLGNLCFLFTFLGGFMLSSMAMLLVRGEASLEPFVFVRQYLLLTPAAIVFVSAVAVLFESISWLSGKLGDVVYFFFWIACFGLVVGDQASHHGISWARYFDFTGFGFMIDQLQHTLHTDSVSIGASTFDPHKAPVVFAGLSLPGEWIWPRIVSTIAPVLLLPLATFCFHRFDPVRTKRVAEGSQRNWIGRLQNLFRPISRAAVSLLLRPGKASLPRAIWNDAALTIALYPLTLILFLPITLSTLFAPLSSSLPIVFLGLALVVADVGTRDQRANTILLLWATRRLREDFLWWKLASSFLLAVALCTVPLVRCAVTGTWPFCALLIGLWFVAALATSLGVMTGNAKTFIIVFLSFWYLVVNDAGTNRWLDFAGFYGKANASTVALYGAVGIGMLLVAQVIYRLRLSRS